MIHEINLKEDVTFELISSILDEMSELTFESGDEVVLNVDSKGGYIEPAFMLARALEGLHSEGIVCRAIAIGKVWSCALVPYMACLSRECTKEGNFLIHPVTINVDGQGDLNSEDLSDLGSEIWDATFEIEGYLREKGVTEEAYCHLWRDGDLEITNAAIAKGFGITTSANAIDTPANHKRDVLGFLKRKPRPLYKLSKNYKTLKNEMGMNEVDKKFEDLKNEMSSKIDTKFDELKNLITGKKNEGNAKNDGEPVTAEELQSALEFFRKTPVEISDLPDVKYLMHPGEDIEKDHFVVPIDKDGKARKLEEGDYEAKVDGEDFLLHSTGTTVYIHGRGAEGNKKNEGEEQPSPAPEPEQTDKKNEGEEVKTDEEKKEPEQDKKNSKAPKNQGTTGTVNKKMQEWAKLSKEYGGDFASNY